MNIIDHHIGIIGRRGPGDQACDYNGNGCGFDFLYLILSFPHTGGETKRCVNFRHLKRNASRIRQIMTNFMGNGVFLH